MNNTQISEVFENIAGLLEMKEESVFTIRAYQRAARTIRQLPTELDQMVRESSDLKEIPGVGQAIAKKITEMVTTDGLHYYDNLRAEFPEGIIDVVRVPGVGPKTAARLWNELGVSTVEQLKRAVDEGALASLPRMGQKKAENILREIKSRRIKDSRVPIARAMPAAERVIAALQAGCPSINKLDVAGSIRRFEETIGDIDLVCTAGEPQEVLDALVALPNVVEVLGHGTTKASVVLNEGLQVDLRVVEDSKFGSLLQCFTGSQQHNVLLREHAAKIGRSLNEYGLTTVETGAVEDFSNESALYERLGLQYIPPELRQGASELAQASDSGLPSLVEVGQLKGDLHVHTDWSDGRDSMEVMVAGAKAKGYEYVAITDHSIGRGIANGLSEERLRQHAAELRRIESRIGGIRVLSGSEVDIRADGSMDYPDNVLEELDWVIGSIHSAMGQDSATMTERIIKAMRNPHVSTIGHLSTRRIGERGPIDADFDSLFKAAAETDTVLEINASPERLDLKDTHVYRARELGAPIVISSDSHWVEALDNQRYGVAVARRGWCEPKHILNTLPLSEFISFLGVKKGNRLRVLAANG